MRQKKSKALASKPLGAVFSLSGFIVALVVGWIVFPNLLYSKKAQPLNFSHAAHRSEECESCHSLRADGTYSGIPGISRCRECHESAQGNSREEASLISDYVEKNREVVWKVYGRQPDNVYFSHAPHKGRGLECTRCHRDVSKEEKLPAYRQNLITGYSLSTMKMVECEKCHASKGASNNCEICHK
ncbi:MAG TPA: menaquinone reductase multiheme cytochrome c subunit QrcA [Syntrophobacteraceae bacterium]|nr:menaquinone reductase multiheme cytochrome c subunit QrcA [Syntrophobacteraceae bacterium]